MSKGERAQSADISCVCVEYMLRQRHRRKTM